MERNRFGPEASILREFQEAPFEIISAGRLDSHMSEFSSTLPTSEAARTGAASLRTDSSTTPVSWVSLSQVLAAMSNALDLTEGNASGHTVRTTLIGMRMAEELDLSAFDRVALYGALLLKDSGSSGLSRVVEVVDAHDPKPRHRPNIAELPARALTAFKSVGEDSVRAVGSLLRRPRSGSRPMPRLVSRAERGESMALRMGFSTATADAIRHIDEHWDGTGPAGRVGHEIPLFSRII